MPSGTAGGLPDTLSPRSNSQIGTGGTDRRARGQKSNRARDLMLAAAEAVRRDVQ